MICLDIYDEENQIYTPYNFLEFCGFECRYNVLTGKYNVNGFVSGAINIASFDNEELAVAVTRSLFTLKSMAEVSPQMEARFVSVDMIVDELENDEEEDEEDENKMFYEKDVETIEKKIEEKALYNFIENVVCIMFGIIIGYFVGVMGL